MKRVAPTLAAGLALVALPVFAQDSAPDVQQGAEVVGEELIPDRGDVAARQLWTINFPSASKRGRSFNYAWTGINNLSRVADETGGDVYSLGTGTPVSLQPHFQEIAQNLRSQYLLTSKTTLERRARRPRVAVTSEAPDAEFFHAAAVNIPAAQ